MLKSTDGGASWVEKSAGLPTAADVGSGQFPERLSIAISASNPLILYAATALFDATSTLVSHIYKTTDGAQSWTDLPGVSGSTSFNVKHYLRSQSFYDNTIVVSPFDSNVVVAGGVAYIRSINGGSTFAEPSSATYPHADAHDLRYQGSTLYVANDGGIWSSIDNGATFTDKNTGLVTRQFYAIANDPVNRNRVLAGAQDNGTSFRNDAGGTSWTDVLPGDGMECAINPLAPTFAYGTSQAGQIYRTRNAGAGTPFFFYIGPNYGLLGHSFFTFLTMDPSMPTTIYTGNDRVWRSTDGGDTWSALPKKTTGGSSWPGYEVSAIAVARSNSYILMVALRNLIFRSTDGGSTWAQTISGLPAQVLTPNGQLLNQINNIEIDPKDPNTAYAALATVLGVSVYQTTNGGMSWTALSNGLPAFAAQVVRVDPTDSNVLYCGTDVGVYRSMDRGVSWSRFGTGLPNSSVQDLRITDDASILRVGTHGRGAWELQIQPTGNALPTATITSPGSTLTASKGAPVTFQGTVADAGGATSVRGFWTFPDTWQIVPTGAGAASVTHAFNWAGVFPVSLAARDSAGALANAITTISVPEAADNCSAALAIPGAGPFPYTVLVNDEAATASVTDPTPSCGNFASGFTAFGHSLWFSFTPAASGAYEFSTCGCSVNTVLTLFTGSACGPYTEIACNDDASPSSICPLTLQSVVSASLGAGQTVYIEGERLY